MNYKNAIVVDSKGNKVDYVLVHSTETEIGIKTQIRDYDLKDGERLIYDDIGTANSMCLPRWNGVTWEEAATPEEIETKKHELAKQIQIEPKQSAIDTILLAIAELYELITGGAA